MYDPAQGYPRIEDGQAVSIPTTNSAVTIQLNWQRCYKPIPNRRTPTGDVVWYPPAYVGWFSYQNVRLRSIVGSTHVVLANARDTISESLPKEHKQFYLTSLFEELNTTVGNELELLSLLCFEQQDKNANCWVLKRRYLHIKTDQLFEIARYGGLNLSAELNQMLVLYHRHTGDNSLWI